jgi:hypothetical protein
VPFADLFIYFFKADISDISVNLFHFSKFSFIGWITDNDRRRLFNLDDAERMPVSFFNGAFKTYLELTLPFYFRPWSPSKRMREDRNGFIAVFALFVCLWRVCGLKKEFEQLQLFPTKIHSSPDILFIWIQNRAFVV